MADDLPKLSLKFVTLLLLLAGLGLSVGLSMERQIYQKQASGGLVSSDPGSIHQPADADDPQTDHVEESKEQMEFTPKPSLEPKPVPTNQWRNPVKVILPWFLTGLGGFLIIITLVKLVKNRLSQVSRETEDLSKGTEIPLEDIDSE